jgi:hypothetical protein
MTLVATLENLTKSLNETKQRIAAAEERSRQGNLTAEDKVKLDEAIDGAKKRLLLLENNMKLFGGMMGKLEDVKKKAEALGEKKQ